MAPYSVGSSNAASKSSFATQDRDNLSPGSADVFNSIADHAKRARRSLNRSYFNEDERYQAVSAVFGKWLIACLHKL